MTGVLRSVGFSTQLTHHAIHPLDNHLYSSTLQELSLKTSMHTFSPEVAAIFMQQMVDKFPYASEFIREATHDHEVEFEINFPGF